MQALCAALLTLLRTTYLGESWIFQTHCKIFIGYELRTSRH